MADRIPCINRRCRRTGNPDKMPDTKEIICGKCWKMLPKARRDRHKQLWRRERKLNRLAEKHAGTRKIIKIGRMQRRNREAFLREYDAVFRFFNAPERPEGLESFLEEVGLDG